MEELIFKINVQSRGTILLNQYFRNKSRQKTDKQTLENEKMKTDQKIVRTTRSDRKSM